MKTNSNRLVAFYASAFFAVTIITGCSPSDMVPVSGVVTVDGKPVPGLTVTFFPEPTEGNNAPGPFSTGVTDEAGKYTLTNRKGVPGAMVWRHAVSFEYDDVDPEAMDAARDAAADAKSSNVELSAEEKAMAKQAKQQMRGKIRIPKKYKDGGPGQIIVDVPAGGSTSLNLEMTTK